MKMRYLFLFLILIILVNFLGNNFVKSEQLKFDSVLAVFSPVGFLCLLDKKDGKIYIYDTNSLKCNFTLQLTELGKPIEKVR